MNDSEIVLRDERTGTLPADSPASPAPAKAPRPPSKPRTRRPRPTFDDGALTRTFKFPSKTYPRSSYYVTADEIIIRIKKARKRWKLVVPKKRLVSYKTNRWFTKPRWVEIELTYTQAVKLKLVEPRAATAAVATGAESSLPAIAGVAAAASATAAVAQVAGVSEAAPTTTPADQSVAGQTATAASEEAEPLFDADADADGEDGEDGESDGTDDAMSISEDDAADDPTEEWDEPAPEDSPDDLAAEPVDGPGLIAAEVVADAAIQAAREPNEVIAPEAIAEATAEDVADAAQPTEAESLSPTETAARTPVPSDEGDQSTGPGLVPIPAHAPTGMLAAVGIDEVSEPAPPILRPSPAPALIAAREPERADEPHRPRAVPIRRFDASLWATTLTIAAIAAGWVAFRELSPAGRIDQIACAAGDATPACASPITTSSIEAPPADDASSAATRGSAIELAAFPAPAASHAHVEPARAIAATPIAPETALSPPPAAPRSEPAPPRASAVTDVLAPPDTAVLAQAAPQIIAAAMPPSRPAITPAPAPCTDLTTSTAKLTVQFDFASSSLDQAALSALNSLAARLHPCTSALITLEGHTDSDGDASRNQALSVRRANEVRAYLQSLGIPAGRLSAIGFGPSRPQAPNTTEHNKRTNRRVAVNVEIQN